MHLLLTKLHEDCFERLIISIVLLSMMIKF